MKCALRYRGIRIFPVKENTLKDCKNHRGEPDYKTVEITIGYSPVGMKFPETIAEAKATIDHLIARSMEVCQISEKEAVKLLDADSEPYKWPIQFL